MYCQWSVCSQNTLETDFFTEYGDVNRFKIQEVIGKGSYGLVCSAIDTHTGEKVAIKKIHDIFEHISDAARILREIKLLRLLRHPDIVEIKHIMLPPSKKDFKDIYVVFELMESDLHQVIKANDDLTREHYQFFLYQMLRALKYIHTGFVLPNMIIDVIIFFHFCFHWRCAFMLPGSGLCYSATYFIKLDKLRIVILLYLSLPSVRVAWVVLLGICNDLFFSLYRINGKNSSRRPHWLHIISSRYLMGLVSSQYVQDWTYYVS